jgi:hypothetical protein
MAGQHPPMTAAHAHEYEVPEHAPAPVEARAYERAPGSSGTVIAHQPSVRVSVALYLVNAQATAVAWPSALPRRSGRAARRACSAR